MKIRIFIQAVRVDEEAKNLPISDREKMMSYEIDAADTQEAVAQARERFKQDMEPQGWKIDGIGSLTL